MKLNTIICAAEIEADVTDEVKILPMGLVKSQKGEFYVDDESIELMRQHFKERRIDIVIDYEHQTLNDVQAPAGGWIKDFYAKDGAIVAKVEWTPKAKEYIANKEYRYLSPVVMVRKTDKKAVILHSVALTNTPAIDGMFTIKNSLEIGEVEMDELLKQLIELFGLSEGATEEEVLSKIKELKNKETEENKEQKEEVVANKAVLKVLELKEDASEEDVLGKIMELKNPAGGASAARLKELEERFMKKEAQEKVTLALKEGKLTKAQEAWALQYALTAPKGFDEYLKNAAVVVPMGELSISNEVAPKMDADTIASVNKMFGYSKEEVENYGKVGK